jgi:hypothetical protein
MILFNEKSVYINRTNYYFFNNNFKIKIYTYALIIEQIILFLTIPIIIIIIFLKEIY